MQDVDREMVAEVARPDSVEERRRLEFAKNDPCWQKTTFSNEKFMGYPQDSLHFRSINQEYKGLAKKEYLSTLPPGMTSSPTRKTDKHGKPSLIKVADANRAAGIASKDFKGR